MKSMTFAVTLTFNDETGSRIEVNEVGRNLLLAVIDRADGAGIAPDGNFTTECQVQSVDFPSNYFTHNFVKS